MSKNFQKAHELYKNQQFSKAAQILRKEKKHDFSSRKLLMLLESKLKNYVRSIHLGKELLSQTKETVHVKEISYLIAVGYAEQFDYFSCQEYLEKSVEADSSVKNALALFELVGVYAKKEQFVKLEKLAPKLLSWQRYFLPVSIIMAESAAKRGNKELLTERLKKLSYYFEDCDQKQFATVINLIIGAEMWGLAEVGIRRYEEKHGKFSVTSKVNLLLGRKQNQEAYDLIAKQDLVKKNNEHLYYLAGKLEEKQKNYSKAFEYFSAGSKIVEKQVKAKKHPDFAPTYNAIVPKLAKSLTERNEELGEKLVFIFGFPRSGTTLLDNILDTQDALVLSERNIVSSLFYLFERINKKYPVDIPKLTSNDLNMFRETYFRRIEEQGFTIPDSGFIIEKGPHFTEMIPFIRTLFPKAKLITTLRHPLDVCVSCFQTPFQLNYYNTKLVTFENVVKRYIDVFSLLERYENELDIKPHAIRYEDLIVDIEGEMTKIFDYIGMTPDDSYLEFNKHAAGKYVTSASRGQTDKALYTSSMYKWRNYEEQVAPYKDKLRHFIEKFGYEV